MKNIWDNVWAKDSYSKINVRTTKAQQKLQIFLDMGISLDDFSNIADFGTGGGYVIKEVIKAKKTPPTKISLFDNSKAAFSIAKKNLSSYNFPIDYIYGDLNFPISKYENQFDLVILFGLLEHLENYEECLKTISKLLNANGVVLLIWSNKYSIFYLQHIFMKLIGLWRYGIQKELSPNKLEKLLNRDYEIKSKKVVSCLGDKGVLTVLDSTIHKVHNRYGRYVFYYIKKK